MAKDKKIERHEGETEEKRKVKEKTKDEKQERRKEEKEEKVEGEEEEEGVEIVEAEAYLPSQKPVLPDDVRHYLKLRKEVGLRRPHFRRQEWFRYKKLEDTSWRKPRGKDSKMRRHYKYRPDVVSIGYGSPKKVRGYHPSGFKEVLVHNVDELKRLNPDTEAARIAHTVGTKKRISIETKAGELGIRVLNVQVRK